MNFAIRDVDEIYNRLSKKSVVEKTELMKFTCEKVWQAVNLITPISIPTKPEIQELKRDLFLVIIALTELETPENNETQEDKHLDKIIIRKSQDFDTVKKPSSAKLSKKQKLSIELFCHSCFTKETPEWRRGPDGPKTLCNACGLHYSKLQKSNKSNSDISENPRKKVKNVKFLSHQKAIVSKGKTSDVDNQLSNPNQINEAIQFSEPNKVPSENTQTQDLSLKSKDKSLYTNLMNPSLHSFIPSNHLPTQMSERVHHVAETYQYEKFPYKSDIHDSIQTPSYQPTLTFRPSSSNLQSLLEKAEEYSIQIESKPKFPVSVVNECSSSVPFFGLTNRNILINESSDVSNRIDSLEQDAIHSLDALSKGSSNFI